MIRSEQLAVSHVEKRLENFLSQIWNCISTNMVKVISSAEFLTLISNWNYYTLMKMTCPDSKLQRQTAQFQPCQLVPASEPFVNTGHDITFPTTVDFGGFSSI